MEKKKPNNYLKNIKQIKKNHDELYYKLIYHLAKEKWYNQKKLLKECLNKKWDIEDQKWVRNWTKRDIIVEYLEQSNNPCKNDYDIWLKEKRRKQKENSKPKKID